MKATIRTFSLCLFLIGTALTASAQLKVANGGTIYMRGDSVYGRTNVSIGHKTDSMTNISNSHFTGLRSLLYNDLSTGHAIGVYGEARQSVPNSHYSSMGMWGIGTGAYTGHNIGVAGTLRTGSKGAGIYGTNQDGAFFGLGSGLAGYFYGRVHVEGLVYSTVGFVSPSDMRLKYNVVTIADKERRTGSTLDRLASLDVLEYNLRTPRQDAISAMPESQRPKGEDPNPDIRHYGVSAQELQKIFPDLVYEDEEGYLSVNYVELVPLLLRSMQELKAEVDELKGKEVAYGAGVDAYGDLQTATRSEASSRQATAIDDATATRAVLYQNTPNPFTAQTEIRFSLPGDAKQAFIYIFDMNGRMQKQIPVSPSQQSVTVAGYELQAGIYLYSLVVGGQEIDTKRMILSK